MSRRRRGATGLAGIVCIDKPEGLTSHDVVAALRRATGEGRIGHAGTLDPLATGLLVALLGPATRLEPFLSSAIKSYRATIRFGTETDTDDATGSRTIERPVPEAVFDTATAGRTLSHLLGESMQIPPAYSAIKVGGETAHRSARAGRPLALEPRPITVHCAELISMDPTAGEWTVDFTVSKGTYVRSLARDIGRALDCAAHLSALRRTSSGSLSVAHAHSLDAALEAAREGRLAHLMADPVRALQLPTVEAEERLVADGRPLSLDPPPALKPGDAISVVSADRRLLAVYAAEQAMLRPLAVFPGGIPGAPE